MIILIRDILHIYIYIRTNIQNYAFYIIIIIYLVRNEFYNYSTKKIYIKFMTKTMQHTRLSLICYVGPKDLGTPAHFISSPRPTPRRKKCLRMNKGNPDCQNILPRTTLSLVDQNHGRGKRHAARGCPLKHPKGCSEPSGPAIEAW